MSDRDDRLRALEQRMTNYYEKRMDNVYLQYHRHPTYIPNYGPDKYTNEGEGYAKGVNTNSKKVTLITDASKSNGLPARHR